MHSRNLVGRRKRNIKNKLWFRPRYVIGRGAGLPAGDPAVHAVEAEVAVEIGAEAAVVVAVMDAADVGVDLVALPA